MRNPLYDEVKRLREKNRELLVVCEGAIAQLPEAQQIMRENGFVIDNLSDRWQKLAFTLYTMIVETSTKAEDVCKAADEVL